jgi:hypothetical protein
MINSVGQGKCAPKAWTTQLKLAYTNTIAQLQLACTNDVTQPQPTYIKHYTNPISFQ